MNDLTHLSNWSDANAIANLSLCVDHDNACVADAKGLVNFTDLNIVISQFNTPCP